MAANDFTGPAVTISSHANGAIVQTKTITLSGTATDAGRGSSGIQSVYVRGSVANSSASGAEVVNWSQTVTLNRGANNITVVAYDNSPQRNETSQTIVINFQPLDTLPPTLTVNSHPNGAVVQTKTINLSGTATDAGQGNNGIAYVYARGTIPNSSAEGANVVNWTQTVTLNRGANTINITAYDNSDVQNEQTISWVINFEPVDPLPPSIEITSHENGQTVGTSTITLQGRATDSNTGNSGISSVYIQGNLPNSNVAGAGVVNWSKTIQLRPGANNIYVYAYDNSDVQNEALETITINYQPSDTLSPVLAITSHQNGATVTTSSITLVGTATDAGRGDNGISSVYVQGTLPNSNIAGSGVVNWSKTVNLRPGANTIYVYAYDAVEFPNEAFQTLVINYQPGDTLGPVLTVTSHTDGQQVNSSEVTISGTATDAGRGDSGISSVYLRGAIPESSATGSGVVNWSKTVTLNPGANTIFIYAYDNAEFPNETSQTFTLHFTPTDSLAPFLMVNSPEDNTTVISNSVLVSGTATDSGRGESGILEVRVNSVKVTEAVAPGGTTVNWSRLIALQPGRNNINISATDNAPFPNTTNKTLTITYVAGDNAGPSLVIESHRNNQVVTTATITLQGTSTDKGSGDHGVKFVTVNGSAAASGTAAGGAIASWSKEVTLTVGDNVISVVSEDELGNSSAATVVIRYSPNDTEPPALLIASHTQNQIVSTSAITLTGTATDNGSGGSGIASVTVNGVNAAGGVAQGNAVANWSQVVNLDVGPNIISVVAKDQAQNSTAITVTIQYQPTDITPPELLITSHAKGQVVLTSTITLAGTATDGRLGDSGIKSVTVNGEPASGGTAAGGGVANWSRSVTLQLGANVLSVVATDGRDNSVAETITLIYQAVDTTGPLLEVTSHKDKQTVTNSFVTLVGYATDALTGGSGISSVAVNGVDLLGATSTGAGTTQWSAPLTLVRGLNVISITSKDNSAAKNSSALSLSLTYDPSGASDPSLFCWVTNAGGTGTENGNDMAVDAKGNSYVVGSFEATAQFGETNIISSGQSDIFVAKWDTAGRLLWVRQAGGVQADVALGVEVDAEGNCYVTGYYQGNAQFGSFTVRNSSSFDLFLAKYDPEGNVVWVSNTPNGNTIYGRALALDAENNILVTGGFHYNFVLSGGSLSNNELTDGFLAKFNAQGQMQWITQMGGLKADEGMSIDVDAEGNSYIGGIFRDEAYFDDETLSATGNVETFLAKYDSEGFLEWVQQSQSSNEAQSAVVKLDSQENVYMTGYYRDEVNFDGQMLSSPASYDLFLAKYDTAGELQWLTNSGTSAAINAAALVIDGAGNPIISGSYFGNFMIGNRTFINDNSSDMFVFRYGSNGAIDLALTAKASATFSGLGMDTDAAGNLYLMGKLNGSVEFSSFSLVEHGGDDLFIGKVAVGPGSPIELSYRYLSGGIFEVSFNGDNCRDYYLQASENLVDWTTVQVFRSPSETAVYRTTEATRGHKFFRTVHYAVFE